MTRRVSFGAVGRRDDLVVMAICGAGRELFGLANVVVIEGSTLCPHGLASSGHACFVWIADFEWADE